jgi:hypothetical protein
MGFHFGVVKAHAHSGVAGDGGALTQNSLINTTPFSNFIRFKRPELYSPNEKEAGGTESFIRVMPNHPTDNTKAIMIFPDGDMRVATNASWSKTSSILNIRTQTLANWTTGSVDGIYPSVAALSSYASVYAVKSTYDLTTFVCVIANSSSYTMEFSNLANLNTAFGANSWVYLGTIAVHPVTNTLCCPFTQSGHFFRLSSNFTGSLSSVNLQGKSLGSGSGAWTMNLKKSSLFLPFTASAILVRAVANGGTDTTMEMRYLDNIASTECIITSSNANPPVCEGIYPVGYAGATPDAIIKITKAGGAGFTTGCDVALVGWWDVALEAQPIQVPVMSNY